MYSKPTIEQGCFKEGPNVVSSISDLSVSSGIVLIPVLLDLLTISVPCIFSELFLAKNRSERIQGTDIVRRSKRTGIRTILELTDKSLIDDTNVGNSLKHS